MTCLCMPITGLCQHGSGEAACVSVICRSLSWTCRPMQEGGQADKDTRAATGVRRAARLQDCKRSNKRHNVCTASAAGTLCTHACTNMQMAEPLTLWMCNMQTCTTSGAEHIRLQAKWGCRRVLQCKHQAPCALHLATFSRKAVGTASEWDAMLTHAVELAIS